ncbi:MAG: hypothetical protein V7603_4685 [Micromonosporaceae bacterium]
MTRTGRPDEATRAAPVDGLRTIQVLACCLGAFLAVLNQTLVATALPAIQRRFQVDHATVSLVVDTYTLTLAGLMLLSGSLADRLGRRRMFLSGLGVFAVGSAGCALAPGLETLVLARIVQAAGGCLLTPATLAILVHSYRDRGRRTRAVGIWSGGVGAGVALGPLVGGALSDTFGWPSIFWLTAVCAVASIGPALTLPESRSATARLDLPGQAAVILFLAALTYTLINGGERGWTSRRELASYAAVLLLGAILVMVERRAPHPVLDRYLLAQRDFVGSATAIFLVYAAMMAFVVYTAAYLQEARHLHATAAGAAMLPSMVPAILLGSRAGRIAMSFGTRRLAVLSCLLMSCALGAMAGSPMDQPLVWSCAGYLILGLGFGLFVGPVTAAAVGCAPADRGGVAAATVSAVRQVGNTLGVAVVGAIVEARVAAARTSPVRGLSAGVHLGYLVTGAGALLAAALAAAVLRPRRHRAPGLPQHEGRRAG